MSFVRETVSKMMAGEKHVITPATFSFRNTEKEKVSSPKTCIHFQLHRPPKYMFVGNVEEDPAKSMILPAWERERNDTPLDPRDVSLF